MQVNAAGHLSRVKVEHGLHALQRTPEEWRHLLLAAALDPRGCSYANKCSAMGSLLCH